ncbi:MAG: hypothetical protein R3B46_06390 [Phycisphaerales bacterium]
MTTRSRRILTILTVSLAGLVLGGCGWTQYNGVELDLPAQMPRLAVDVENFAGNVDVVVDPDIEYACVKYALATDGIFRSEEEREAGYERMRVTAEVIDEGGGAVLVARSVTDDPTNPDHRAYIRIVVPRCDGVRIVNQLGDVELVNVSGAIEVANRFGSVELRTETPMTWPVTITTVDGNIYYQVPAGSTGYFDLMSLDGEASYKDEVGGTSHLRSTASHSTARLNGGANTIVCRTNAGNVRAYVMENPTALTRAYKHTLPDFREALFLEGSRRHTRNLPTGGVRPAPEGLKYED